MRKRVLIGIYKEVLDGKECYGASALDYPGCVAVGDSAEEATTLMREALASHIEGMLEDGDEIPQDIADYAVVDVQVPLPEKVGHESE